MKAIVQDRYGGPEVLQLREVATPVPGDDCVLVRIHAVPATLPDCAMRKADPVFVRLFHGLLRPKYPILGTEFSGEIAAVGRNVARFKVGDAVIGATCTSMGGYAEYVVVPEAGALGLKPANLTHAEAAGLTYSFLTAMPFLRDEGKVRPGQRVLVNGASGSIGTVAVQLARHLGAEVTGVCSTGNVEMVRSLGAARVIDYKREDFAAARCAYDIIFDAVGKSSFARARRALTPDGVYLTTVPTPSGLMNLILPRKDRGRRHVFAATGLRNRVEKAADLAALKELAEAGVIRPVIDRLYPLAEAAKAHAYVDTERKAGDVILAVA